MAGTQKAPAKRQRVGKDPQVQGSGTRSARGEAPKASPDKKAEKAAKAGLDRVVHVTCARSGSFQLRQEVNEPNRPYQQEWTLRFGDRGFVEADEATLDAVRKVLDGKWSDELVGPETFQRNARMVGLGIKTYGLETAPIPSFDLLAEDRAVTVAYDAGALGSVDAVKAAIRYENESPEREPAREPRDMVLRQLKALLDTYEAKGSGGAPTATVTDTAGGAAPAGGGLPTGAQEIG